MVLDLLTPVAPEEKLHKYFKYLISLANLAPARDMLRAVWAIFPGPDEHFVLEFQTRHFDARIWELCVFAAGHFSGHKVSRPEERPDFLFERHGLGVWIEATTANPSEKYPEPKQAETEDEAYHHMYDVIPIRLGSALYSKLSKEYWNLPHVAGKPFVIAIEDFSEDDPFRMNDAGLFRYLYGIEGKVTSLPGEPVKVEYTKIEQHEHEGKKIPSRFFDLPGADNVSAVIFSNEGTLPKFKRMGFNFDKYPFVRMMRVGTCIDFDPTATLPNTFGYLVGDAPEEWVHGMYVYHNPGAKHPIPVSFFKGFGQHWIADGAPDNLLREFSPMSSTTFTIAIKDGKGSLADRDDEFRAVAQSRAQTLDDFFHKKLEYLAWRDKFVE